MTNPAGLELLTTAVLLLDETLCVTYANPAAETLFAHGRKHLVGARFEAVLPNNEEFIERLAQARDSETGFNDNDLLLEVEGYPAHLHCVASPLDTGDPGLVLEFRELQQQMKIAREAKILEQQEANRELIRNLAHEMLAPVREQRFRGGVGIGDLEVVVQQQHGGGEELEARGIRHEETRG